MYSGKFAMKPADKRRKTGKRAGTLLLSLLLLASIAVGGTLAFISTKTADVKNTFTATPVRTEVEEDFDSVEKTNVTARNTGETDAYIRLKLISYRVNESGNKIGGIATVPDFTLGAGWAKKDGFYYYTSPVAPGETPAVPLAEKIILTAYGDDEGGKQVVEVMAEAIQANGTDQNGRKPVVNAWGVDPEGLK